MPVIFPYVYRGFLAYGGDELTTELRLAVRLLDEFSEEEPIGYVNVKMKGREEKPFRNLQGYYCFTNLPPGNYVLSIESDFYLPVEKAVVLPLPDKLNPSLEITLIPKVTYPLPSNSTSIRGIVTAPPNIHVQDATVEATFVLPASDPIGTIGQVGANQGASSLAANITGPIQAGDVLMIKDSDFSKIEFSKIKTGLPQPFGLVNSFKFSHGSGTPLHLMKDDGVLKTKTDRNGEFVIYLKNSKARNYLVKIKVTHQNYQPFQKEIEVNEGREISLGKIQVTP